MNPVTVNKWKDARWRQSRSSAEAIQAALVKYVDLHWRELGLPDPKLFFALAVYLGKPTRDTAFFVAKRLNELGMPAGGPRLALFVPRRGMAGLLLWIAPLTNKETPEERAMKRALGAQGYDCMTVFDVTSGARIISEYLAQPELPCGSQP